MSKLELIKKALTALEADQKAIVLSEYCEEMNYDECVYSMDSFNTVMGGLKPIEVVNRAFYGGSYSGGQFNPNAEYFHFNGYGNLESLTSRELGEFLGLYLDELAKAIEADEFEPSVDLVFDVDD